MVTRKDIATYSIVDFTFSGSVLLWHMNVFGKWAVIFSQQVSLLPFLFTLRFVCILGRLHMQLLTFSNQIQDNTNYARNKVALSL